MKRAYLYFVAIALIASLGCKKEGDDAQQAPAPHDSTKVAAAPYTIDSVLGNYPGYCNAHEDFIRNGVSENIVDYHGPETFHLSNDYPYDKNILVAESKHSFGINGSNLFRFDTSGRMTSLSGISDLRIIRRADSVYFNFHWSYYDASRDAYYAYDFDFAGKR